MKEDVKDKEISKETKPPIPELSKEAKAKEAEAELFREYKENEYGEFGVLRIYHPTMSIETELDDYYTKEFNKLLMESDFPTIIEMEDILEERGSWDSTKEDKINSYKDKIQEDYVEIAKLRHNRNKNNKKVTDKHIRTYQDKIIDVSTKMASLIGKKEVMFQGTLERQAEKKVIKFKIVKCVKDEDDKQKWNSLEELDKEIGRKLEDLISDCIRFWSGMQDFLFESSLNQVLGDLDIEQV